MFSLIKKENTKIKVAYGLLRNYLIYSHYTTKHEEGKRKQRHTDIPCPASSLQLPRSGSAVTTTSTSTSTTSTRWRRVFSMDAGEILLRSNMGTPNHALIIEGYTRASGLSMRLVQEREEGQEEIWRGGRWPRGGGGVGVVVVMIWVGASKFAINSLLARCGDGDLCMVWHAQRHNGSIETERVGRSKQIN